MVTIVLSAPVQFGKGEVIEKLELKPTGRALRGLKVETRPDGGIVYEPHALAVVGFKMAGHVAAAETLVDRMESISDLNEIATAVLGFFASSSPAPSKDGSAS